MIRFLFSIFFLFAFISNAMATSYRYDPSQSTLDNIYVGVFLTDPEGRDIEGDLDLEIANKIVSYFRKSLENNGINLEVEIELYFPWECHLPGIKMARYRPAKEKSRVFTKRDLLISIGGNLQDGSSHPGQFRICMVGSPRVQLWFPEDFPTPEFNQDKCLAVRQEDFAASVLCDIKPNLDAIIWGLVHPKEN